MLMEKMIEIKDLQVKYGDFIALDNINLDIKKSEFFTLIGPSGCGKTTMLNTLVGFLEPSEGDIIVKGKRVNDMPSERRNIGIVFQSYALFPTMTVEENIGFGLKIEKTPKEAINQRVHELSQIVDLNETQLKRNVSELSGGQQQRVAIARALAKQPEILTMDEPLSNLDAQLRKQLRLELKRIQRELGMTTIYVTHDQEEALILSDRIAVFNKGTIEQVGTPDTVYNDPASEFVCTFIGDATKLTREFAEQHTGKSLEEYNAFYIRPDKISIESDYERELSSREFRATVTEVEFYGTLINYHLNAKGINFVSFEKQNRRKVYDVGNTVVLSINPDDILCY